MINQFGHASYQIRRKVLQLFGATFHVSDPNGQLAFYTRQKAFKLREDIRLYTDEEMRSEVLLISARQIIDFGATYDVHDSVTGERVGALKRRGVKSILRDEWVFLDLEDREIGLIKEDSTALALLRRFVINLIPQSYSGTIHHQPVATYKQNFNPFVTKMTVDFTPDTGGLLDRRLGIAAGILLCAIEGKQA